VGYSRRPPPAGRVPPDGDHPRRGVRAPRARTGGSGAAPRCRPPTVDRPATSRVVSEGKGVSGINCGSATSTKRLVADRCGDVTDAAEARLVTATSISPRFESVERSRPVRRWPSERASPEPIRREDGVGEELGRRAEPESRTNVGGHGTGVQRRPGRAPDRSSESATWACSSRPRGWARPHGGPDEEGKTHPASSAASCWLAAGWERLRSAAPPLTDPAAVDGHEGAEPFRCCH
jgi:hypothetical protein